MIRKVFVSSLLISAAFYSSPSLAGWENVGETVAGDTFYVNLDTIKKNNANLVLSFDVSKETLKCTNFNNLYSGSLINLENHLKLEMK